MNEQASSPTSVLISGGSGLLGTALTKLLQKSGYHVGILSRNPESTKTFANSVYQWSPEKQTIDMAAIEKADYIIHLAGAGIADKRWTKKRKAEIINSRVQSGSLLFSAAKKKKNNLKGFFAASGVNYYGSITTKHIFSELDAPGDGFLGRCCQEWEKSSFQFKPLCRTAVFRLSAILSSEGGALKQLIQLVNWGFGAPLGSGRQYFPWIHIDDACRLFLKAIQQESYKGIYNASSPHFCNNDEFMKALRVRKNRPLLIPRIPGFALKLALGELSEILLNGSRVSPSKLLETGFDFQYDNLNEALKEI